MTWDQLNSYVHSTARYLKEIRVLPGTRVAIFSRNSVEYIITLLSLWRVGACVMPLSVYLSPLVLESVLKSFSPHFLFTADQIPVKVGVVKTHPLSMLVSYVFTDGFFSREAHLYPTIDLESDAAVVLTSGSSGIPKGVLLSYGNFLTNASGANELIPFLPADRWLLSLPLWHVSGLAIIFRALSGGGAVVVPNVDEPLDAAILNYRVTHLSLVPMQLKRIMASRQKPDPSALTTALAVGVSQDSSGLGQPRDKAAPRAEKQGAIDLSAGGHAPLKNILLGGAPIPTILAKEAVRAGFPLYATYGLTETASQIATGPIDHDGIADVRPLKGREVKISPDGEILVRGAVLFRRYLFGGKDQSLDDAGWYHTGDLGCIDEAGRLSIKGRMDNMFISGGENIYPEVVERALMEHPAVDQAVVVGIDDADLGCRPAVFVRFRGKVEVMPDELVTFLKDRLARHEIPKIYYVWPELEKDFGLKLNRKAFIELVAQGKATLIPTL